ncbi:hypothetical protein AVEN_196639-1 [Araneus ventricosus]|uniref:Uncharacterized protein n=1 Tax=Araneus ventricosus TaxID=182803 RepID=A0A4Y2E3T4_ARAVE|nr:hypothetical protein AVEN_196639-1 [Araneus ventricosus]
MHQDKNTECIKKENRQKGRIQERNRGAALEYSLPLPSGSSDYRLQQILSMFLRLPWPSGKVSALEPEDSKFEILIPLKIHHVLGLLHVKSYILAKHSVNVVWKFGEVSASSGVVLVICAAQNYEVLLK